jgi:hypothetical protein
MPIYVGFMVDKETFGQVFSEYLSLLLSVTLTQCSEYVFYSFNDTINPLNAQLNPICHLLALLEAHHILHVSRLRINCSDYIVSMDSSNMCWWYPFGISMYRTVVVLRYVWLDFPVWRIFKTDCRGTQKKPETFSGGRVRCSTCFCLYMPLAGTLLH